MYLLDLCEAAHPEDRTQCQGPQDAVRVTDGSGGAPLGCVLHGARLYASLEAPLVEPVSMPGAAVEVVRLARMMKPFDLWRDDVPDTPAELLL